MFAVLVLLGCLTFGEDAPVAAKADKEELKKLQGKWFVAEHEHGGKKTLAKELANLTLEVQGTKMITYENGEFKEGTSIIGLDPKAKPATLDLRVDKGDDAGKVVKAIWKRTADTLTICVAEPGKDRPKEFEGKKDTGHTLMVFKKAAK
jgi:uncharacterized protein (TIGR03067 family)